MTATPLYAALLALLFVRLSLGVIRLRRSEKISLGDGGDGGDRKLMRAQRVHANFAEYVPFALILMALAEAQDASIWLVHGMGVACRRRGGNHVCKRGTPTASARSPKPPIIAPAACS